MKIVIAAAFAAGSATVAAAQGFDGNAATRGFPQYADAGTMHFYIGQMQGPMAGTPIHQSFMSAQVTMAPHEYAAMRLQGRAVGPARTSRAVIAPAGTAY